MDGGAALLPPSQGMLGVKKMKQKPRYWNEEEDALLKEAIQKHGTEGYHTWKEVAKHVPNRSYRECMQRWTKVLAPGLKKGKWSAEEDQLLIELVTQQLETLGEGSGKRIVWNKVSQGFKGRSCKQCRERWINHLDPSVKKTEWTQEEDLSLLQLFETMPNKWAKIARQIPGRTENMVKVRWNALNRQAKKRKQNALYYPGRHPAQNNYLPVPAINGYFNGIGGLNTPPSSHAQSYNQFYINNQISLSLNNNAALARQQAANGGIPGTPGGNPPLAAGNPDYAAENQVEWRKNSLYMQMNMNSLPMHNMNNMRPPDQNMPPEQRKPSFVMNFQQNQQAHLKFEVPPNGDGRKDSLCLKDNFSDEPFKGENGLPRTGSLAQLHKFNLLHPLTPSTPDMNGGRRLSLTINNFNFDEQADGENNMNVLSHSAGNGSGVTEPNNRRLSSFLCQDLIKNMSSVNASGVNSDGRVSKRQCIGNPQGQLVGNTNHKK